jgi:hypothetical protein
MFFFSSLFLCVRVCMPSLRSVHRELFMHNIFKVWVSASALDIFSPCLLVKVNRLKTESVREKKWERESTGVRRERKSVLAFTYIRYKNFIIHTTVGANINSPEWKLLHYILGSVLCTFHLCSLFFYFSVAAVTFLV